MFRLVLLSPYSYIISILGSGQSQKKTRPFGSAEADIDLNQGHMERN